MTGAADKQAGTRTGRYASGLIGLLVIAGTVTLAVSWMERETRDEIAANELAHTLAVIATVLPPGSYDNRPESDVRLVTDSELLGSSAALPVYTARANGEVVANVLTVEAPDGYVSTIRLLVGIDRSGAITGVRAISHRETPGLGDRIEAGKADWILGFNGRRQSANDAAIALRQDGGDIDQISGATITSRAVSNAVANALRFYAANQPMLLTPAATRK